MRARQQAAARAEADAQLEHWLSGWDNAVAPPGAALQAGKSPRTGAGAARPEQYVFLLSAQNQGVSRPAYRGAPANAVQRPALPELQLQAMVSYPKTTDGWIKPKPVRTKPAPGQAAAQGPGKNASYSQVTIFQNAERPASVTIPIIGTGQLTSEVASAR